MLALDGSTYDYVIVGAGVAASAAVKAIREADTDGSVLVLGLEPDPPAYRPDLDKTLWLQEDHTLDDVWLLDGVDAEVRTSLPVTRIDTEGRQVEVDGGARIGYGSLLIATGASPRRLDLPESDRIIYFRTVADYRALRGSVDEGTAVTVVGGGYIGAEIASALTQAGAKVTMVMTGELIQQHMFPASIARLVTQTYRDKGVHLITGAEVVDAQVSPESIAVRTDTEVLVEGAVVVIGIGVSPNTELASDSGIAVEDGIVVDQELATSAAHVFAAGDDADYPDPILGRRRVEHVDNAEAMGAVAGKNMTGAHEVYDHTPIFWSDLFDYGYEAVGDLNASADLVEDWNDDRSAAVVYYLDDGVVRGVLLWNVWDSTDKAIEVLRRSKDGQLPADKVSGSIPTG